MPDIILEGPKMVRLRTDPRLWELFSDHHIWFGPKGSRGTPVLDIPRDTSVEEHASFDAGPRLLTSMGAASFQNGPHPVGTMGRYCSIADRVSVMGERHPVEHVTTSAFPYRIGHRPSFDSMRQNFGLGGDRVLPSINTGPLPALGHDVWIGYDAMLARGITLGTGCIIAARAVVTKNVPAYAIVGGNPARLIRMRFSDDIIAGLLALKWWDLHPSILFEHNIRDPQGFIETVGRAKAEIGTFIPRVLTCAHILAAV
jgi:acetyltransferase-like isoleucine patch superfamily enzyme